MTKLYLLGILILILILIHDKLKWTGHIEYVYKRLTQAT